VAEVIVAVDVPSADDARRLIERVGPGATFLKVGLELYTRAGPTFVQELRREGRRVFLDLKLHDIPNTVAGAVAAAVDLDVDLLTLHASGGRAMIEAARRAAEGRLRLLAVTLLTSLSPDDVASVWGRDVDALESEVARLSTLAHEAGAHGVVASPLEAARVRTREGPDFLVVTPGIRPSGADRGDQKRVASPAEAVRAGADYLVVGRPVTAAPDPQAALAAIVSEIAGA